MARRTRRRRTMRPRRRVMRRRTMRRTRRPAGLMGLVRPRRGLRQRVAGDRL